LQSFISKILLFYQKSPFKLKKTTSTSKTHKDKTTALSLWQDVLFETPLLLGTYKQKLKKQTSY